MSDYALESTFDIKFTSRAFATGIPTTLAGTPAIVVYEDDGTTEITVAETLSVDFDGVTGLNNLRIVATAANGFELGKSYSAVLSVGTVGGVSVVGETVANFTIGLIALSTAAQAALEDQYDGVTGLVGDTYPLRQDQGASISGGLAVRETATSVTVIQGAERGLSDTGASNNTRWTGDDTGAGAEFIFRFVPSDTDSEPGDLHFEGFYADPGAPFTNSATIETYNFTFARWDVQETLTDSAEDETHDDQLSNSYRSPNSDTIETVAVIRGDVLVKFKQTAQETGNAVLNIDQITVGFISSPLTASEIVDEWETQSQADPTGFHVNVLEVNGTGQTANDNGADINAILIDVTGLNGAAMRGTDGANTTKTGFKLASDGLDLVTAWTTNITGSLSGSVGSVSGAVGSVTSAVVTDAASRTASKADVSALATTAQLTAHNSTLITVGNTTTSILDDTAHIGVAGVGLTDIGGMSTAMKAEVESQAAGALTTIFLDRLFAADYDPASPPGIATALLNELIEDNAGVSRYTAPSLENAPSGTGASAAVIADAVWDELRAGHVIVGSFGESNQVVSSADVSVSFVFGGTGYCSRSDINDIFGTANVTTWADLDNDGDAAEITARVARAIAWGTIEINDRLRGGRYTIPLPITAAATIVDLCATLAGVWLYRSRGVDDESEMDKYKWHWDRVETALSEIRAGKRRLDAPSSTDTGGQAPFSV